MEFNLDPCSYIVFLCTLYLLYSIYNRGNKIMLQCTYLNGIFIMSFSANELKMRFLD